MSAYDGDVHGGHGGVDGRSCWGVGEGWMQSIEKYCDVFELRFCVNCRGSEGLIAAGKLRRLIYDGIDSAK